MQSYLTIFLIAMVVAGLALKILDIINVIGRSGPVKTFGFLGKKIFICDKDSVTEAPTIISGKTATLIDGRYSMSEVANEDFDINDILLVEVVYHYKSNAYFVNARSNVALSYKLVSQILKISSFDLNNALADKVEKI